MFNKEKEIFQAQEEIGIPERKEIEQILFKGLELQGLTIKDCSKLLKIEDREISECIFETAFEIKGRIFGPRIALFVPLYVTNVCRNECLYCGFRCTNKVLKRKTLSEEEVRGEARALAGMGHRRICLVYGDNPHFKVDDIIRHIAIAFDTKENGCEISEVCINIEPPSETDFQELKKSGLPIYYRIFQETYHREAYRLMHVAGPKVDYDRRISVFDKAISAGIRNIGLGALFGLYDYKFEVLSLIAHAKYLNDRYGVKITSISVPKIEPALNTPLSVNLPSPVSDFELKKIIAILRLAIPHTEIIITTRESPEFRIGSCRLGVSEMSAGSRTSPGGYAQEAGEKWIEKAEQFRLSDHRSLDEVAVDLCLNGHLPSFWSECTRNNQAILRSGSIIPIENKKDSEIANSILTFDEYLSGRYNLSGYDKLNLRNLIIKALQEIESEGLKSELNKIIVSNRLAAPNLSKLNHQMASPVRL